MIEPQLLEAELLEQTSQVVKASNAIPVRLLDTQARGHIGRHLLRQQANGELTEDAIWRWSSAPDRYLDTALRLDVAASSEVRLVDAGHAPALASTLLTWDLESAEKPQLVGVVEFEVTGIDRVIHTRVVRTSEPVSTDLPGDLPVAAGRLLHRLSAAGLAFLLSQR
jgi:hypothetical protein